jgi:hypothetical protein
MHSRPQGKKKRGAWEALTVSTVPLGKPSRLTNSIRQNPSWEPRIFTPCQALIQNFLETEGSLLCKQGPQNCVYHDPDESTCINLLQYQFAMEQTSSKISTPYTWACVTTRMCTPWDMPCSKQQISCAYCNIPSPHLKMLLCFSTVNDNYSAEQTLTWGMFHALGVIKDHTCQQK